MFVLPSSNKSATVAVSPHLQADGTSLPVSHRHRQPGREFFDQPRRMGGQGHELRLSGSDSTL